jgi:hypothetical protein
MSEGSAFRGITFSGLPINIELWWPFHPSTSGGDFHVLHGDVRLLTGGGLHALVATQLTLTVAEMLPSLEPEHATSLVINSIRKELDRKQLELMRSPKRVPVYISSRVLDLRARRFRFNSATDDEIGEFLERKLYWLSGAPAAEQSQILLADSMDAEYLGTTPAHLLELGRELVDQGRFAMEGDFAFPNEKLMSQAHSFESAARAALESLEKKHAFERG